MVPRLRTVLHWRGSSEHRKGQNDAHCGYKAKNTKIAGAQYPCPDNGEGHSKQGSEQRANSHVRSA